MKPVTAQHPHTGDTAGRNSRREHRSDERGDQGCGASTEERARSPAPLRSRASSRTPRDRSRAALPCRSPLTRPGRGISGWPPRSGRAERRRSLRPSSAIAEEDQKRDTLLSKNGGLQILVDVQRRTSSAFPSPAVRSPGDRPFWATRPLKSMTLTPRKMLRAESTSVQLGG